MLKTFIEKKEKEFRQEFASTNDKYLGNDFAEYPKANIHDALVFLRQSIFEHNELIWEALSEIVRIRSDNEDYILTQTSEFRKIFGKK